MQKTINKFLNASVASSLVAIILGVLFLVFPIEALDVFRWIIAILAFLAGGGIIVSELSKRGAMPYFGATAIGAVLIVIGIIFATRPTAINIFTIVLGAWFIVTALGSLRYTAALSGGPAIFSTVMALVALVAGILLIINPWGATVSIMALIGACLMIYGVVYLVNTLVLKSNVNDIAKKLGVKKK